MQTRMHGTRKGQASDQPHPGAMLGFESNGYTQLDRAAMSITEFTTSIRAHSHNEMTPPDQLLLACV